MHKHGAEQLIKDADEALAFLKEGNKRFVKNKLRKHTTQKKSRRVLAKGQKPFAVVLCCSDSRVAPEIFFDQRLGDIFVIRNAGNVVDPVVLGSIEYSVEHLKSPLVVVVGHKSCGAVTTACGDDEVPENIASIVNIIKKSITKKASIDEVVHGHALKMAEEVKKDKIIKECNATVKAAYYDIETGVVSWLK